MKVHCLEGNLVERKVPSTFPSLRLLVTAILSVLSGGFHFGYQISVINPMADILQDFIKENVNSRYSVVLSHSDLSIAWSAVAGSLFIGATLGAYVMSIVIDRQGPRIGLLYSAVVLLLCVPLCGLSYRLRSAELFVVGRLLSGLGVGMGTTAQGVFLAEISPVRFRGVIGSFGGFSTNIGFIMAGSLGLPIVLGKEGVWPIVYYVEVVPCLILLFFVMSWFHDSPVFLWKKGDEHAARAALRAYAGSDEKFELDRIRNESKCEESNASWRTILKTRSTRNALLLSATLNVVVSFSGILAVSFFGTFLLQSIGFSQVAAGVANTLSALSGTVGALVGMTTVDKLGRRLLVIGSLVLLAAVNTFMMVLVTIFNSTQAIWMGWAFLLLFIAFLFIFSAGIGPTAWFLGAELAPSSARAKIQSVSVAAQYISCFISPLIYYPLYGSVGPLAFLVFIVPLSTSAVYFYRYLPETKGKPNEEILELLE